eukprot:5309786-Lingulodinium_polyedra.AAC.1
MAATQLRLPRVRASAPTVRGAAQKCRSSTAPRTVCRSARAVDLQPAKCKPCGNQAIGGHMSI